MKIVLLKSELPYDCRESQITELMREVYDKYSVNMMYGVDTGNIHLEGSELMMYECLLYIGFQMGLMSEGR